ncbi:hypothetical protein FRZ61_26760 [Hypericibacter adhaerens]|uniref:protein O-GlcNAc transferase n=1 Tax=Hypericibacter adhaerens TaxID=2602016 RepID=A0A5J6N0I7_9PROT|nr:tetratricopeptide repeat protein [Hypericibacter adhaerens]QEX22744.1 hypothetical protein FRZ61_26760 [Hypericibacter adhaerens]
MGEQTTPGLDLAIGHLRSGRPAETAAICRARLAADPADFEAWHLLGVARTMLGETRPAIEALTRAVELRPDHAEANRNLGALLAQGKRFGEAIPHLEVAHQAAPDSREAIIYLARALRESGQPERSAGFLEPYLASHPQDAEAWYQLALALAGIHRPAEAIGAAQRALAIKPDHVEAERALAGIHFNERDYAAAIAAWRRVAALRPRDPESHRGLAKTLAVDGHMEEADAALGRVLSLAPDWGTEIRRATLLRPLMRSLADIDETRRRYGDRLAALAQRHPQLRDPNVEVADCVAFYLAYHGRDDLPLQRQLAALYLDACPALGSEAPHLRDWRPRSRPRIGVVSTNLNAHTVGFVTLGLLQQFDRSRFELVLLRTAPPSPSATQAKFSACADQDITLPSNLAEARARIAAAQCDLLYYPDIGMAPLTYFLLFARLAPVQVVGWGHPDTTGIPNADYWMSSAVWEPAEADDHYTERLVRLAAPPIHYEPRVWNPPARSRAELGLPETGRLYLCPMSLFKIHPGYDPLLRRILQEDPEGWLLFASGHSVNWDEVLKQRVAAGDERLARRILFLPRYEIADFTALGPVVDCQLDPIYFGGGRTSLDIFHTGAPIVTWPGPFMRSRITSGFYRRMGVTELVARGHEDYVALALRTAKDDDFREAMRRRIRERAGALYKTVGAVREVEDFFAAAIAAAGNGQPSITWNPPAATPP